MISKVIKKDNRIESFNGAKLRMSIEAAFRTSGCHCTQDCLDDLRDQVLTRLGSDKPTVHSSDIRDAVKLVLFRENWDEVIDAYCGNFRPKFDGRLVEVVSTIYRLGREGKTEVLSVLSTLIDAAIKDANTAPPQLADNRSDAQVTETVDQENPVTNKELNDWLKAKPGRILRVIFPDNLSLASDDTSWDVAEANPDAPAREYACSYIGDVKSFALMYVLDGPGSVPVPLTREALSAGK